MTELNDYEFPAQRLKRTLSNDSKTPLCLVACGSFSPITHLHLRMFEMAVDFVRQNTNFEVVAGYLSPVSDSYNKPGLAAARHRISMCELACEQTSSWLMVDTWEALQPKYQPTAIVLDHFEREINETIGGMRTSTGEQRHVRVMMLAGSDLIKTMSEPGVWAPEDLEHILGKYGTFLVERAGTDVDQAMASLTEWRENIYIIRQMIQNDISSTKIRLFLRRGMSVHYLIPTCVIDYIRENGLYQDDGQRGAAAAAATSSSSTSGAPTRRRKSNHDGS